MAGPLARAADALQAPRVQGSGGFWPPRGADSAALRDQVLVFVTDGQVGNEDWIMGELAPNLQVCVLQTRFFIPQRSVLHESW